MSQTKNISFEDAMKVVVEELTSDKDYYRSWFASISMAMQDNSCSKECADKGAKTFLEWLTR